MIKFFEHDNLLEYQVKDYLNEYKEIYTKMKNKTSAGNDFLGWNDLAHNFDEKLTNKIKEEAKVLRTKAKTMIVIGIGGSYLGAKAVAHALQNQVMPNEYNLIFMGQNMSSAYLNEVIEFCKNNDFVVNVISKSGTTLEPALAFRLIKELLVKKYGEAGLKERLVITTDESRGALKEFALNNGLDSYVIPDDVGGRFSVFTPVGLVPLAFIGINLDELLKGANKAALECFSEEKNIAFEYALNRFLQYKNGKSVEAYVIYEPALQYLIEWLKQLFGESEGKEGKGLLPIGMTFSTDLHSLGQFIQEGKKIMFETVIKVKKTASDLELPFDQENEDKLNNLREHSVHEINSLTLEGVIKAHVMGEVPNLVLEIEKIDEYNIGYLLSFMMYTCAYSAYLLDVNPFNQPGVEVYKKEIYKIL